MLKNIINDNSVDIRKVNYSYHVEKYLISKGMRSADINELKTKICK